MDRIIFHVDVNSAFLSWESTRRLKTGQTDLREVPAIVGGDRNLRTSVVLAKSIPAKRYGIQTGEPVSMALRKCPSLIVAEPDFSLYKECSDRFMSICRDFSPLVEQFSIDECFLDMTGMELLWPDIRAAADGLRERIRNELGFTVNVGIGNNKFLAKTASDFEKPDKTHTLYLHEIEEKLWPLPVSDMLFVGKSTAEKLIRANICTIGQIAAADPAVLCSKLGEKQGAQVMRYAHGVDDSPVCTSRGKSKSFSIVTTVEDNVTETERAHRILLTLAEDLTHRMRTEEMMAGTVAVTIRGLDFKDRSHQCSLFQPTDSSSEVYRQACSLFDTLWDGKTPLRLIGISLTDLCSGEETPLLLFSDEQNSRKQELDRVMDRIRDKYGYSAIRRASEEKNAGREGRKEKEDPES